MCTVFTVAQRVVFRWYSINTYSHICMYALLAQYHSAIGCMTMSIIIGIFCVIDGHVCLHKMFFVYVLTKYPKQKICIA